MTSLSGDLGAARQKEKGMSTPNSAPDDAAISRKTPDQIRTEDLRRKLHEIALSANTTWPRDMLERIRGKPFPV